MTELDAFQFAQAHARHLMTNKGGMDKLTELPSIMDEERLVVLRILNMLILLSLEWNQRLCPLVIVCVIKLNMTYGMTPQMPSAIALYGSVMHQFGLTKEAYRYGEAALALQQAISTDDARVTVVNHVSSFLLVRKLSDCLKTLRKGWEAGLKTGDITAAMICAQLHCWVSLLSGQPLRKVSRYLEESSKSMKMHSSMSTLRAIEFHQEATGRLLGDPAYDHRKRCCKTNEGNNLIRSFQLKLDKMIVAVFLNNYELAWETSEQVQFPFPSATRWLKNSIWRYIYLFYRGISAFGESRFINDYL